MTMEPSGEEEKECVKDEIMEGRKFLFQNEVNGVRCILVKSKLTGHMLWYGVQCCLREIVIVGDLASGVSEVLLK